jgi:hypothetical protein
MKAMLVRVGADQSDGGGRWNGPVEPDSGRFAYVAIPESKTLHAGCEKPYRALDTVLAQFDVTLPSNLQARHMHLDPDFSHLTYGDQGQRAKQLKDHLSEGDWIVFYAGLSNCRGPGLVYALIGVLVVERLVLARELANHDINAHSRRVLSPDADDVVIMGQPSGSGRLGRCLPIGEYRDRAYRVRRDLLEAWGGLSVKDGYLQRSARLPVFLDPAKFETWFSRQCVELAPINN